MENGRMRFTRQATRTPLEQKEIDHHAGYDEGNIPETPHQALR